MMETWIQESSIYTVYCGLRNVTHYNLVAHINVRANVILTLPGVNGTKNTSETPVAAYDNARCYGTSKPVIRISLLP